MFSENIFTKIISYVITWPRIHGAIEVPEICRKEGVNICWDGVQVMYVSCFSSAGQSFPHEQIPHVYW